MQGKYRAVAGTVEPCGDAIQDRAPPIDGTKRGRGGGGGVGTRPRHKIVCLWRRLLAALLDTSGSYGEELSTSINKRRQTPTSVRKTLTRLNV